MEAAMATCPKCNPAQIAAMALIGAIILIVIVALLPHAALVAGGTTGDMHGIDLMSYDD
jgi:hypothetical protein